MTMREYGSRTAATNFLRGKGIAAVDFNKFINATSGKFLVNDALIGKAAEVKKLITSAEPVIEKPKLPAPANLVVIGTDLKANTKSAPAKRAAAKPKKADAKTGKVKADKKPAAAKPAAKKGGRLPISQRCLELFKAGKDNAAVWEVVSKEYALDEDRAHYPAWYRSHFRRKGLLPAASARVK